MQDLFRQIGVTGLPEMIEQGMTMGDIFVALTDATDGNQEALARAFGSVEALNAAIGIGTTVNQSYLDTLDSMTNGANEVDAAFAKQKETFAANWQELKNVADTILITVGNVIIPILIPALQQLADFLIGVIDKLRTLRNIWQVTWDAMGLVVDGFVALFTGRFDQFIAGIGNKLQALKTRALGIAASLTLGLVGGAEGEEKRQSGGLVKNAATLVGERGPEIAFFPRGTRIAEAGETRRILNSEGAGGVNFDAPIIGTVNVMGEADEDRLATKVQDAVARAIQLQRLNSA